MDIVDRLYHQLELAMERAPAGAARSPTIGDIYQHLIPYRSLRGELGIWELAEYEHALLRLLAGERGHVRVETAGVREEILRELASPNPILGIYRDYPAVQVSIGRSADAPPQPFAPPQPTEPSEPTQPSRGSEPSQPVRSAEPATAAAQALPACRSCRTALPEVPGLRFCPACGHDQLDVRCDACDASLAPDWNYCIRCGEPRGGGERADRADR